MQRLSLYLIGLTCLAAGCSEVPAWESSLPQRRPLGASHTTYTPESLNIDEPVVSTDAGGPMTLAKALSLALLQSPTLEGMAWSVRQSEAEQLQASLMPNPEVEAEVENFAGSGELRGSRSLETTVVVSQLFELGGKRDKRMALAEKESKLAGWEYEAKRLELLRDVSIHYTALLQAQQHVLLAKESLALANTVFDTARKRVQAGKAPKSETLRASVEVANAKIDLIRSERLLLAARQKLASTWGATDAPFDPASGALTDTPAVPELSLLQPKLEQNPALAQFATQMEQGQAALTLAQAEAIPDLTVGVGYRRMGPAENHDEAMVVVAGMELPVFNRNEGEIAKARFALSSIAAKNRAAKAELQAALREAYEQLAIAQEESVAMTEMILPTATEAYEASEKGFQQGKGEYMDVLDAQRTLVETRYNALDAQSRYHQYRARVESLIGQSIESVSPKSEEPAPKSPVKKEESNE
jgi:cobalt-zinc-cadmium efflux system outer membrane protein